MEGDAGASQLNPTDADDSLRTEVTTEDSSESEAGADQTGEAVTTEDSSESEAGADPTDTEGSRAQRLRLHISLNHPPAP